jgi:hypothetical protein
MAENKKSFILYADQQSLFFKLPDDIAGQLIKHIFSYVNDEDPVTDNLLLDIAFEPIKLQLKRDLKVWEETKKDKSLSGRIGNLKRWNFDIYTDFKNNKITLEEAEIIAHDRRVSHPIANIAVNDTVNVTVTNNIDSNCSEVAEEEKDKKKKLVEEKKQDLYNRIAEYANKYPKEMLREFYEYWTELNDKGNKMRFQDQKYFEVGRRLVTWQKNLKADPKKLIIPTLSVRN